MFFFFFHSNFSEGLYFFTVNLSHCVCHIGMAGYVHPVLLFSQMGIYLGLSLMFSLPILNVGVYFGRITAVCKGFLLLLILFLFLCNLCLFHLLNWLTNLCAYFKTCEIKLVSLGLFTPHSAHVTFLKYNGCSPFLILLITFFRILFVILPKN